MHKLERDFYLAICTLFSTILLVTFIYYMNRVKRLEAKLSDATKKNEFMVENRKAKELEIKRKGVLSSVL